MFTHLQIIHPGVQPNPLHWPALMLLIVCMSGQAGAGGAACVMAKYQGKTLDYALVYGKSHPVEAQEAAEDALRAKGFANYLRNLDVIRGQNLTALQHARVIVIRSEFDDIRGKPRSAMGCGFSATSYRAAELDAVRDLQVHFWGWKPDQHGYEVVQKFSY